MEQAQNRIAVAFSFQFYPFVKHIARHIIYIHRHFIAGKCIGAGSAHSLAHFVVLVGNSKGGRNLAYTVNSSVDVYSFILICAVIIQLIKCVYLIEIYFFFGPVETAILVGALEQHVF